MPLTLDHIVIAVPDLDATSADYRALGFTVVPGGQHPGRSSHNALVVFGDGAYLELIAWRSPAPQERWYRTLCEHGPGLVDFALRARDTRQALTQARARGLDTLTGPFDGSRLRPDGVPLRWQTARQATPDVPFLCGDVSPRALRVPEGAVRTHPNGTQGVASLTVAVHDLDQTLARYQALLGSQTQATPWAAAEGIRAAQILLGSVSLLLQSPAHKDIRPQQADSEPVRALRGRLAARGAGPCSLTLRRPPGNTDAMGMIHGRGAELLHDPLLSGHGSHAGGWVAVAAK